MLGELTARGCEGTVWVGKNILCRGSGDAPMEICICEHSLNSVLKPSTSYNMSGNLTKIDVKQSYL